MTLISTDDILILKYFKGGEGLQDRKKTQIFIISAFVVMLVATVVAFCIAPAGKIHQKKSPKKNETSVSATTTTTTTTTTQPTTVDERGSTDSVKKLVALCFDDGPSGDTTPKLLEGLKKRGAHATFFVVGENIAGNEAIIKSAVEGGNDVEIHCYTHTSFLSLGLETSKNGILKTSKLIQNATGKKPTHVRPPEGALNDETQKMIKDIGFDIILWNVDTMDWSSRDADTVYNKIISNGADGGDILCVHDLYSTTVDAALRAIDTLQAKGYKFVTISELEAARDKFVPGRIWYSGHEFYNIGSKENTALASLKAQSTTKVVTDASGNTQVVTEAATYNGTTDVPITWPSDAKKP